MAVNTQEQAPQSVIVVGAGSAGSVVARRLADAGVDVTVLEGGGEDTNPAIHDPARMGELWHSADDWDYYTVPLAAIFTCRAARCWAVRTHSTP